MPSITLQQVPIDLAIQVDATITEFDTHYSKAEFESRYKGTDHLIVVAFIDDQPAGYMVSYDKDRDGSFYCWMAGVSPQFRRLGILRKLMDYLFDWAKSHQYSKITIKTRNNRREMLAFLVKSGFNFTEIQSQPAIEDSRILLEKSL